jgi:hypothetical protein
MDRESKVLKPIEELLQPEELLKLIHEIGYALPEPKIMLDQKAMSPKQSELMRFRLCSGESSSSGGLPMSATTMSPANL